MGTNKKIKSQFEQLSKSNFEYLVVGFLFFIVIILARIFILTYLAKNHVNNNKQSASVARNSANIVSNSSLTTLTPDIQTEKTIAENTEKSATSQSSSPFDWWAIQGIVFADYFYLIYDNNNDQRYLLKIPLKCNDNCGEAIYQLEADKLCGSDLQEDVNIPYVSASTPIDTSTQIVVAQNDQGEKIVGEIVFDDIIDTNVDRCDLDLFGEVFADGLYLYLRRLVDGDKTGVYFLASPTASPIFLPSLSQHYIHPVHVITRDDKTAVILYNWVNDEASAYVFYPRSGQFQHLFSGFHSYGTTSSGDLIIGYPIDAEGYVEKIGKITLDLDREQVATNEIIVTADQMPPRSSALLYDDYLYFIDENFRIYHTPVDSINITLASDMSNFFKDYNFVDDNFVWGINDSGLFFRSDSEFLNSPERNAWAFGDGVHQYDFDSHGHRIKIYYKGCMWGGCSAGWRHSLVQQ